MTNRDAYVSPLGPRYASTEMLAFFGDNRKFSTWRRLWAALARCEKQLGVAITGEQIAQLEDNLGLTEDDYEIAGKREREVRHDVMAHVYAYGKRCPLAAPIIHLGATSMYVVDNTDLIIMRDALSLVRTRLLQTIAALRGRVVEFQGTPCLSYTHFQPAQPTTFGRRLCLYIADLLEDFDQVEQLLGSIRFLGAKGTTGTQESFLKLFGGDHEKVKELDKLVAKEFGFDRSWPITGQTYTRKFDARVLQVLTQIAISAHKFANDMRLLMGLGHLVEPQEKDQIGSSAMAYKINPMRCERMTSLSRVVIAMGHIGEQTAAEQWLERTLDDSAGKRISIPEALLSIDAILAIYANVASGMVVFPKALLRALDEKVSSMATEEILMRAVTLGGDRQALHEKIRTHSRESTRRVCEEGLPNDLLMRINGDPAFASVREELLTMTDPVRFIGRSAEQALEFLADLDDDLGDELARVAAPDPNAVRV